MTTEAKKYPLEDESNGSKGIIVPDNFFTQTEETDRSANRKETTDTIVEHYKQLKNNSVEDGLNNKIDEKVDYLLEDQLLSLDDGYYKKNWSHELDTLYALSEEVDKAPSQLAKEDANYLKMIKALSHNELLDSYVDKQVENANQANALNQLLDNNPINNECLDIAKENNLPPSLAMTNDGETQRLLKQFNQPRLDTRLNTPVTYKCMQNTAFASKNKDHVKELQRIETDLNKGYIRGGIWYASYEDWLNTINSDSFIDNASYGIGKAVVGIVAGANWLLKHSPLDYITIGPDNVPLSGFADRSLVEWSNILDSMHRNVKGMEEVKQIVADEKGGVMPAIGRVLSDPLLTVNLLAQELPSNTFGGGAAKAITYTGKGAGVLKTVVEAGVGSYLGSIAPNIEEKARDTKDATKAVNAAQEKSNKQLDIDMMTAFFNPFRTKSQVLNTLANDGVKTVAKQVLTATSNGENVNWNDVKAELIFGVGQSLSGIALDKQTWRSLSRDIKRTGYEIAAGSDFVKQNPSEASDFINQVTKGKRVYISSKEFVDAANKNNVNAYELLESITGDSRYLDRQLMTGGYVELSSGDFIARVLTKISINELHNDIKTSPLGLTSNERVAFEKNINDYYKKSETEAKVKLDHFNQKVKEFEKVGVKEPEKNALLMFSTENAFSKVADDSFTGKYSVQIKKNSAEKGDLTNKQKSSFIELGKDGKTLTFDLDSPIDLKGYVASTSKLYLNGLQKLQAQKGEGSTAANDLAVLKNYLKVENLDQLPPKVERRLMAQLENYFSQGKVDDPALKPIFERYRQWGVEFSDNIQQLKPSFDAELTQKLQLMRITDTASDIITQAPYTKLFEDNNQSIMTPAEYSAYRHMNANLKHSINDQLFNQNNKELTKQKRAELEAQKKQIHQEETMRENNNPAYQVRNFLIKGILKDGSRGQVIKLDRAEIVEKYGESALKKLQGLTQDNGVSLAHVADVWGYKSTDDLVVGLINSANKKQAIETRVNARMEPLYNNINEVTILQESRALLEANQNRPEILAFEEKVLLKNSLLKEGKSFSDVELNKYVSNDAFLATQAGEFVKRLSGESLKPENYFIIMQRHNHNAAKAYQEGDFLKALEYKKLERANYFIYRKLLEDKSKLDKIKEKLNTPIKI